MLNVGDYIGQINTDREGTWKLYRDKINKVAITKKYGRRYYVKSLFYPLDADDVDNNTKIMGAFTDGPILIKDVFGLNNMTEQRAERWIKWANDNPDKVKELPEFIGREA